MLAAFLPFLLIPACAAPAEEDSEDSEGAMSIEVGASKREVLKDLKPGAFAGKDSMLVVRAGSMGRLSASFDFSYMAAGDSQPRDFGDGGNISVDGDVAYFNGYACKMQLKVQDGGEKVVLAPLTGKESGDSCWGQKYVVTRHTTAMLVGKYTCYDFDNYKTALSVEATATGAKITAVNEKTEKKIEFATTFSVPGYELTGTSTTDEPDNDDRKTIKHSFKWIRAKTLRWNADNGSWRCEPTK